MRPTNLPASPLSPEEERRVLAGINASEADDAMALTAEEAEAYGTGVLAVRVTPWAASRR